MLEGQLIFWKTELLNNLTLNKWSFHNWYLLSMTWIHSQKIQVLTLNLQKIQKYRYSRNTDFEIYDTQRDVNSINQVTTDTVPKDLLMDTDAAKIQQADFEIYNTIRDVNPINQSIRIHQIQFLKISFGYRYSRIIVGWFWELWYTKRCQSTQSSHIGYIRYSS